MKQGAIHFIHLLQFLYLEPENQISFCGDEIPDDASELLSTPSDSDDKRYDLFRTEQMGNPLDRFYWEYCDYKRIFTDLDENFLSGDDTVLEDIESRMAAMVNYRENNGAYNYYWGKNQLRDRKEWKELKELSRSALRSLNTESRIPEEPFEHLLYID